MPGGGSHIPLERSRVRPAECTHDCSVIGVTYGGLRARAYTAVTLRRVREPSPPPRPRSSLPRPSRAASLISRRGLFLPSFVLARRPARRGDANWIKRSPDASLEGFRKMHPSLSSRARARGVDTLAPADRTWGIVRSSSGTNLGRTSPTFPASPFGFLLNVV